MTTPASVDPQDQPLDTRYFPEEVVRDGLSGCCHDFALAVHRKTGLPLGVLWKDPLLDQYTVFKDPMPVHMFVVSPDGDALDVEGKKPVDQVLALYRRLEPINAERFRAEVFATEEDWLARCALDYTARFLQPREHGIAAADKVIWSSKQFVNLLLSLPVDPRARARVIRAQRSADRKPASR